MFNGEIVQYIRLQCLSRAVHSLEINHKCMFNGEIVQYIRLQCISRAVYSLGDKP